MMKMKFDITRFLKDPVTYGIPDDYFGIKKGKKTKNGLPTYTYLGNTIQITGNPSRTIKIIAPISLKKSITVSSQSIWDLIVLDTPFHKVTNHDLIEYGNILIANNFSSWMEKLHNTHNKRSMMQSDKYNTIILPALEAVKSSGQGMSYYTISSPLSYRKKRKTGYGLKMVTPKKNHIRNSTIEFFPGNKKVLLKKLIYLLGEYHCGNNKSLRNEIVPIIQYLKSQHALPAKFNTKSMNWIYD